MSGCRVHCFQFHLLLVINLKHLTFPPLRPSVPWSFAVSKPPAKTSLWTCFEGMGAALWLLLSVQKATLGTGACVLGAASVLQCHGVLLFRNRPLRLRYRPVLARELHFGCWFLVGSEGSRCTLNLVSCRFRRQHWALEPACWAPLPSFSAMMFCCLGTVR